MKVYINEQKLVLIKFFYYWGFTNFLQFYSDFDGFFVHS